jgi:hypothetical protein
MGGAQVADPENQGMPRGGFRAGKESRQVGEIIPIEFAPSNVGLAFVGPARLSVFLIMERA